jgi:hypothetical protein
MLKHQFGFHGVRFTAVTGEAGNLAARADYLANRNPNLSSGSDSGALVKYSSQVGQQDGAVHGLRDCCTRDRCVHE